MKLGTYFRGGRIVKGLDVNKEELVNLMLQYKFISVSEADKNNLSKFNNTDYVGTIMGDIDAINDASVENPDCWFVNKDFMAKNYKNLETSKFTFGEAIELLKLGYKVARTGWNGKGMFLFLVPGSTFKVSRPPLLGIYPEGTEITYQPHIDMKTAQNTVVPWLASQSDVLAEDWMVVF